MIKPILGIGCFVSGLLLGVAFKFGPPGVLLGMIGIIAGATIIVASSEMEG